MAEAEPSQSTGRDTGTNPAAGFGRFKNDLADYLELRVIKKISNLLELKPGKIERITRSETPGHDMVDLLENREVIAPTGISDLVDMVHELNLPGLAERIQKSFQATKGQSLSLEGFGSFKVALADVLTDATVLQLAIIFDYPPVIIEELGTTVSAGLLMIRYMEERGQIKTTSILELLSALKKICNSGTVERVKKLYEEHTGKLCPSDGQSKAQEEGKLKIFTNSLKHTYALWYNRIQPIPYIREKICCVDDIYVESGLELVHQPPFFKHDSQSFKESGLVSLKSFRDVFDSDIIPSNRILLEGDPGYGKSTLTLQVAHDWCLGNVASLLKNVAVFILLPLRLLGNISSIFEAIRLVLMPPESPLTGDDILEILRHSLSVVIVLDGYDEYPDKNSMIETDIMKILAGKMFPNFKVVVSTRSSSLPTYLHPTTVTIRLTGFDEKSRDEYIQRTVTGGDQEASRHITNALNNSPILNDICQVPMFCVIFVHVTNDQQPVIKFSSVTSFFKYVIDCFYSHMWKKDLEDPSHRSIREYPKLNRLAFDSLTGKTQNIDWPKHTFINTVGNDCYEELSNIGILIVYKNYEIIDEPKEHDIHHIKQSEFVRFYHKLFAEWYAAMYLSSYAGSLWPFWLNYTLNDINPVDLQFVFRFACGLNKKASGRIIKYLKSVKGSASFASLCFFEQPDNSEEVGKTVKGLCSDGMSIRSSDSRLLQRSNIQLLEIASRKKIPLSCLVLDEFHEADQHNITLVNGYRVPVLSTLEEVQIRAEERTEFTQEQFVGLLCFAQQCPQLQKILFIDCLVPLCFPNDSLWPCESDKLKVLWKQREQEFDLNFTRGRWTLVSKEYLTLETKGQHSLTNMCSGTVTLHTNDTNEYHMSVLLLLQIAESQQIQITSLMLKSFSSADQNHLILESRNRVPLLPTLKELQIKTNLGKEFTQDQVIGLFCFAQQCQRLKKVLFIDCLLPLSLPVGSLSPFTKLHDIDISWKPSKPDLHLDPSKGKWMLNSEEGITLESKDVNSLRRLCSSVVFLLKTDSKQLQMSTILLLEIASSHNIPISHLYLVWSFSGFDGKDIRLTSGLSLSSLSSVEKISTNAKGKGNTLSEEEVIGLINYGINSPRFKALWLKNCKLPSSIKPDIIPEESRTRNIKVISSSEVQFLDLESGKWRKPDDIQTITEMCSSDLIIHRDTSESVQRSIIELLVEASNHNILIDRVTLNVSLSKIDEYGNIILSSGLSLPIITSIENMTIHTEKGREMNEHEVNEILNYLQHSQRFEALSLSDCLLPSSIPVGPSLSTLKSRGVRVSWTPDRNKSNQKYNLDFGSGLWLRRGSW